MPALCALHPELRSAGTCTRCGAFACAECSRHDEEHDFYCATCFGQLDPFGVLRRPYTVFGSAKVAWALARPSFPVLAPLLAVLTGLLWGLHELVATLALGKMSATCLQAALDTPFQVFTGTVIVLLLSANARGKPLSTVAAFRQMRRRFWNVFFAKWRANFVVGLHLVLLVIPGVLKALSYSVVFPLAATNSFDDPLDESQRLTRGRRGSVLGSYAILFLVVGVVTRLEGGLGRLMVGGGMPFAKLIVGIGAIAISALVVVAWPPYALAMMYGLRYEKAEAERSLAPPIIDALKVA